MTTDMPTKAAVAHHCQVPPSAVTVDESMGFPVYTVQETPGGPKRQYTGGTEEQKEQIARAVQEKLRTEIAKEEASRQGEPAAFPSNMIDGMFRDIASMPPGQFFEGPHGEQGGEKCVYQGRDYTFYPRGNL